MRGESGIFKLIWGSSQWLVLPETTQFKKDERDDNQGVIISKKTKREREKNKIKGGGFLEGGTDYQGEGGGK